MKRETAEKAAKWWGDMLCHHHDNGANDRNNQLAMVLADMIAASNKPTDEQISKFVELLTDKLIEQDSDNRDISIYCDYHPDIMLREVADEVGIDSSVFPYKTGMSIYHDNVEVKVGYGSSYTRI